MKYSSVILSICLAIVFLTACQNDDILDGSTNPNSNEESTISDLNTFFEGKIDFNNLPNYADQNIPNYIDKDNTGNNAITDEIACASCHKQELAFGDDASLSEGVNGLTKRHSMRLINTRFADETRFFWDERALTLEEQSTMPIQDHIEMGYSGQNNEPGIQNLIDKLSVEPYYLDLFNFAFGSPEITEVKMQDALAQFIRSIQSFDSRYDEGVRMVNNLIQAFPNFTDQENLGKRLFMQQVDFIGNSGNRIGGGLGCQACHSAPEFDIRENSNNNGVIGVAGNVNDTDLTVERSPSLRDLFNSQGVLNGPLMHTGNFDIEMVLDHYNDIDATNNNNLDVRLRMGGGQNLNMTLDEKEALIAFLKTLSGSDVYINDKWSSPFAD